MSGLLERMARKATGRASELREEMLAQIAQDMPGLTARIDGEDVIIEGRDLLDRWLRDARLRDLGRTGEGRR